MMMMKSSFLVEETGVPGGNHRPTESNWRNFSHIRPLPSPGICVVKQKARRERRLSSLSYRDPSFTELSGLEVRQSRHQVHAYTEINPSFKL